MLSLSDWVNPKNIDSVWSRPLFKGLRWFVEVVAVAVLYYFSARLGLLLALEGTNASPVWPPSGIALAALLILGWQVWPGITIGAFLANLLTFLSSRVADPLSLLTVSSFISLGNTLEALVGIFLIRQWIGPRDPFGRVSDTAKFITCSLAMCLSSSAIGPTALALLGVIPWPLYKVVWFTWWLGDATGVLVLTPALVVLWNGFKQPLIASEPKRFLEAGCLLISLLVAGKTIFGETGRIGMVHLPLEFVILPLMLWATFRFGQTGVVLTALLVSWMAVEGTLKGLGPFVRATRNESLLLLQTFIGIVTSTGLVLASLVSERRRGEEKLREAGADLERRVKERTRELKMLNESLEKEIIERRQAEEELRKAYRELERSQEAALNIMEDLDRQKKELHQSNETLVSEITERRRVADALRASESRFRRLAESNLLGIIVEDLKGRLLDANEAFFQMVGYTRQELLLGKVRWDELTAPEWRDSDRRALEQLKKLGIAIPREKEYLRKDGGRVPVLIGMALLEGSEEECICFVLDLTERKRAEETKYKLEKKEIELARANTEREQSELFAFVASHDLQEPLHKVVAFGDLLKVQASHLDEKSRDYVERMQSAAARMSQLIQDLLSFCRVTTKTEPFETVSLKTVVEDVLKDLDLRVKESNATVEIGELPTLNADRAQMHQLFQNLIANSLKFQKKGRPSQIQIHSRNLKGGWVEIVVEDNGIGFDEKHLARIFKPFERLHSLSEYAGSGMGLAICQKIVARHGGRITARGAVGKGSTFLLTLPTNSEKETR